MSIAKPSWKLGIDVDPENRQFQLAIAGSFLRFTPSVNILDGKWHDVSLNVVEGSFNLFVDGKQVAAVPLTTAQSNAFFSDSDYGLAIGGNGPWKQDPNGLGDSKARLETCWWPRRHSHRLRLPNHSLEVFETIS